MMITVTTKWLDLPRGEVAAEGQKSDWLLNRYVTEFHINSHNQ